MLSAERLNGFDFQLLHVLDFDLSVIIMRDAAEGTLTWQPNSMGMAWLRASGDLGTTRVERKE